MSTSSQKDGRSTSHFGGKNIGRGGGWEKPATAPNREYGSNADAATSSIQPILADRIDIEPNVTLSAKKFTLSPLSCAPST